MTTGRIFGKLTETMQKPAVQMASGAVKGLFDYVTGFPAINTAYGKMTEAMAKNAYHDVGEQTMKIATASTKVTIPATVYAAQNPDKMAYHFNNPIASFTEHMKATMQSSAPKFGRGNSDA